MNIGNAGEFNHKIGIYQMIPGKDAAGFATPPAPVLALSCWAKVKTTKGFTLIANGSDFEKAFTNFTIRYPKTAINRDMIIMFRGKRYTIEYMNNVDEASVLLELQCKEVTH